MKSATRHGNVRQGRAELHPGSPPAIYRTGELFENARSLRRDLGDETFFERLNASAGADADLSEELGTWGSLSGGWNASSFESAASAPPSDPEPERLLQALVATHFTAFARFAASDDEALVGIDDGLAALSRHAQCRPPHEPVPVGPRSPRSGVVS